MEKILKGIPQNIHFRWCGYLQSKSVWKHEERINSDFELMIGVRGNVFLEIEGEKFTLREGNAILIPPGTLFKGVREAADIGFYWLHFKMDNMNLQNDDESLTPDLDEDVWELPLYTHDVALESELSLIQQIQIVKEIKFTSHQLLDAYTSTLLLSLSEKNSLKKQLYNENQHYLIRYMENFLKSNYQKKINLDTLANYFGYNKAYLSNLYSKQTGQTITKYLQNLRLEKATKLLLTSDVSIFEVAQNVGIGDEKYFSRLFQINYKIAPSEYREKIRKSQLSS